MASTGYESESNNSHISGNNDYSDVGNPIYDLQMSTAGREDIADSLPDADDSSSNSSDSTTDDQESNHEDNNLDDKEVKEEEEEAGSYFGTDMLAVYELGKPEPILKDLKYLCDLEGINYTLPMENQVKRAAEEEPMSYECLQWYVRGIILANQTQVIPTVTGAISEMKMETKYLQQSSTRINNEIKKIESVSRDMFSQLDELKTNLKEQIDAAIKTALDLSRQPTPMVQAPIIKDNIPLIDVTVSEIGHNYGQSGDVVPDEVVNDPVKHAVSSESKHNQEMRNFLIGLGLDPTIITALPISVIHKVLPVSKFSAVKKVKLNQASRVKLRDTMERLIEEELLGEDDSSTDSESDE
ncbi:putative phosphoprotein [Hyptis latent virus]|uniref:Phosphoprotein n=1 Tax=Hyptis latent virus TaxID=2963947 RepID=A0AAE9SGQ8_9RHAB|nr:putative phosphoprotein [Hyptis latent virus]